MGMDMAMRDGLDRGYIDPSPSIKAGSHGAAVEAISTQPVCFVVRSCTLGQVLVAWSPRGVCAVFLGDNETELIATLRRHFPQARAWHDKVAAGSVTAGVMDDATTRSTASGGSTGSMTLSEGSRYADRIVQYIERPSTPLDVPLDLRGTDFQRRVWSALCGIPAGSTASYTQVARQIGAPLAVRAVAGACAANLIAVAIPCHRVVRRDGGLSGYRWGVHHKRALLAREAHAVANA